MVAKQPKSNRIASPLFHCVFKLMDKASYILKPRSSVPDLSCSFGAACEAKSVAEILHGLKASYLTALSA